MSENERLELLGQIKWLEAQVEALELELSDAREEIKELKAGNDFNTQIMSEEIKELNQENRKLQEAYSNASWSIENGRW